MQENKTKLQVAKEKVLRRAPTVVAMTGAAVAGAYMMSRYNGHMSHLVSVHTTLAGYIQETGQAQIFETSHGTFMLAPVVKQA